jgi:hypothetical protein
MSGSNTRLVGGVTTLTIDGTPYDVVSDVVWSPSSVSRETKKGLSGVFGYIDMPTEGFISAKLLDNQALTVKDFNSMTFSTVIVYQANGKQITATNAWCVAVQEVNSSEATFDVRFESASVTEN